MTVNTLKQIAGRGIYILLGMMLLMTLFAYKVKAQDHIGGGFQIVNSKSALSNSADFGGFFTVRKELGKFAVKGLAEFTNEPELPSILQRDVPESKMDGSELRLRPQVSYEFYRRGNLGFNAGVGVDYYKQFYPNAKDNYTAGLNPLITVGVRYKRHEFELTRIAQELKVRGFKYYSFVVHEYENDGMEHYEYIEVRDLQNKGTLNPSYLQGWQANYTYTHPIKDNLSLYFGGEFKYLDYRKSIGKQGYISYYRETDPIAKLRIGLVFGGTK